ncbi:hypothetical protein GCM10011366_24010 [Ornithinimicrobium tianjinense]|uniref:Uncharacterized protein n=1 Tax=Ornithinimicrobium tianjinense TaxID=1195761 RepID=A0A917BS13_9MICO|nr:hypothetical protein GCM10011366_24010 [Ornithinimicrobium tianjinense]
MAHELVLKLPQRQRQRQEGRQDDDGLERYLDEEGEVGEHHRHTNQRGGGPAAPMPGDGRFSQVTSRWLRVTSE